MLSRCLIYLRNRWYIPLIVVFAITTLLLPQLLSQNFDLSFTQFLPDSEKVDARERMEEHFDVDANIHYLLLTENNKEDDILTPASIRAGLALSRQIEEVAGVGRVVSISQCYDHVLQTLSGKGVVDTSDDSINNLTGVLFRVASEENASVFLSFMLSNYNVTPQEADQAVMDIRTAVDTLLSSDYLEEGKARHTLLGVSLDQSLSPDGRKNAVTRIMSAADDFKHSYVSPTSPALTDIPFDIKHTGEDLLLRQMDDEISLNKYILASITILFIAVVLKLSFRRFSRMLLPLLTLGMVVIWTFAIPSLFGMENSPLDLAILPLVAGLGIDYFFHLFKRYDEEMARELSSSQTMAPISTDTWDECQNKAIETTARNVSRPLFVAAFTTIAAFMTGVFSSVQPVANLGILCSLGIVLSVLFTFLFLLPISARVDRFFAHRNHNRGQELTRESSRTPYIIGRSMNRITRWVTIYPVLVLIVIVLATTLSLVMAVHVEREFDEDDFVADGLEAKELANMVEEQFSASSTSRVYYYYVGQGYPGVDVINDMAYKMLYIEEAPLVQKVNEVPQAGSILEVMERALERNETLSVMYNFSPLTHLPQKNCTDADVMAFLKYLEGNTTPFALLESGDFSGELSRYFHADADGYSALIVVHTKSSDWEGSQSLVEHLGAALDTDMTDTRITLTGWVPMEVETVNTMQDTQLLGTVVALVFALVVLVFIYRNVSVPLLAMLPVVLSTIWIMGLMYALSLSLNILTITVTSLVIGIGLDYSIHVIERFNEEHGRKDRQRALKRTLKYTGSSIFMSSFTTILAFLLLLASSLPVMRTYGLISGIAVLFAFLLSSILVPIILLRSIRQSTAK